jgi:hypothetical protein
MDANINAIECNDSFNPSFRNFNFTHDKISSRNYIVRRAKRFGYILRNENSLYMLLVLLAYRAWEVLCGSVAVVGFYISPYILRRH